MKISFRGFGGEIPRTPAALLPEGSASLAANCDLMHGVLRGLRGNLQVASGIGNVYTARPIVSVYTEDGINFFGWEFDGYFAKSQVVDDTFYRVYYTLMLDDGPVIRVARTQRPNGQVVIGSGLLSGNFQPPENSTPPLGGGPDSWVLGVPAPEVQGEGDDDALELSLVDKAEWPGIPRLRLRVTYFIENMAGQIVAQLDISNNETANAPNVPEFATGVGFVHENVFISNDWKQRNNKIQDLLSLLGPSQRPYKYYFFAPPDLDTIPIARTVPITNNGAADIVITYTGTPVNDPTPLAAPVDGGPIVGGIGNTADTPVIDPVPPAVPDATPSGVGTGNKGAGDGGDIA